MIKIFRNIRRKFLRENRFTHYLLYALGEIILVVIGILLALQINTWNEERKLKKEREVLISSMISDLEASRQRLSFLEAANKEAISRTSKFLELSYSDNSKVSIDSLQYYFSGGFEFPYFEPVLTSYEQAVSSGKISLIDDKEFYNKMSNFLTSYERYKAEARLSGEVFYLGSFWEMRKEVGNIVALAGKSRARSGRRKIEPDAFKLQEEEYRSFIKRPEVFAALDNMRTIFYNVNESFEDMDEGAKELIMRLEKIE